MDEVYANASAIELHMVFAGDDTKGSSCYVDLYGNEYPMGDARRTKTPELH